MLLHPALRWGWGNLIILTSSNLKFCRRYTNLIPKLFSIQCVLISISFESLLTSVISYLQFLIPHPQIHSSYPNLSLLFLSQLKFLAMKSYNGTGNHRMKLLRLRRASLRNHLAEEQDCSCHMCTRNITNLKKKGKDSKEG